MKDPLPSGDRLGLRGLAWVTGASVCAVLAARSGGWFGVVLWVLGGLAALLGIYQWCAAAIFRAFDVLFDRAGGVVWDQPRAVEIRCPVGNIDE